MRSPDSARPDDNAPHGREARRTITFESFRLDPRSTLLFRGTREVPLPVKQFEILYLLASRAGAVVTKDEIMSLVWPKQFVSESSVLAAISHTRRLLDPNDADRYIVTVFGRGYRFAAPVTVLEPERSAIDLDDLLAPYAYLIEGRAELVSWDLARIARARTAFESFVARFPDDARFRVGLANACALLFEAGRASAEPDTAALRIAIAEATRACELDPNYAEAWATLGFVLGCAGEHVKARAALLRATGLEPDNGLHFLRLAAVRWGAARITAARRALELMPDAILAHVLIAIVFIARGFLDDAEREIDAALRRLAATSADGRSMSVVAVYWIKALLCFARGEIAETLAMCERELALEGQGHLYATECCASVWYLIGACRRLLGDIAGARAAFMEALARVPRHAMAHVGMLLTGAPAPGFAIPASLGPDASAPVPVDLAVAKAIALSVARDIAGATSSVAHALAAAPAGNAGWLIPIEPLLGVQHAPEAWKDVLLTLKSRAE